VTQVALVLIWVAVVGALVSLWFILKRGSVSSGGLVVKQSERPIEYWVTVTLMCFMAGAALFMALVLTTP